MNTEKVAVYGGAFNPPTLAHKQIVSEVLRSQAVSHIILSPSGQREDKDFGIEQYQRRKLIEIFFHVLRDGGLNISLDTHFFEGKNLDLTTTTAEEAYFRKKLGVSPYFIFGSDVAPNMPNWTNNTDQFIEKKLKKIFISRPGYHVDFTPFDTYMILDIPNMLEISSSLAREMIRNKKSVRHILPPEIAEEISKSQLYIS